MNIRMQRHGRKGATLYFYTVGLDGAGKAGNPSGFLSGIHKTENVKSISSSSNSNLLLIIFHTTQHAIGCPRCKRVCDWLLVAYVRESVIAIGCRRCTWERGPTTQSSWRLCRSISRWSYSLPASGSTPTRSWTYSTPRRSGSSESRCLLLRAGLCCQWLLLGSMLSLVIVIIIVFMRKLDNKDK